MCAWTLFNSIGVKLLSTPGEGVPLAEPDAEVAPERVDLVRMAVAVAHPRAKYHVDFRSVAKRPAQVATDPGAVPLVGVHCGKGVGEWQELDDA